MVKQRASSATAKSSKPYKIAGTLADGVAILAPKTKPDNFTSKQIKSTIEELRRNGKIGGAAKVEARRD